MPTAERGSPDASSPTERPTGASGARGAQPDRRWAWGGLAVVLVGGLALRLWGVKTGLPYVYNIDEAGHFVPKAVAMSSGNLNPHYFVNPPALTYVLHAVFAVWFGGGKTTLEQYARHPGTVFLVARVTVALLGAGAIWLLYLAGARLFDRRVALLAAALEAVAFLPVFYGHFALNDAPTLAPLTLSLWGSALVLRRGRPLDYILAGVGLGLGCAVKYTAGIALLPLVAAAVGRHLEAADGGVGRRLAFRGVPVLAGLALAAAGALVAFLLANPYSILDFHSFHSGLIHQSSLSSEAQGKLGAPNESGIVYYLWSFTWGLGWAPALAAVAGAALIWRRQPRLGWVLVPAPVLFMAFMGLQGRYFGRWLLPIFPVACLLAAFFALAAASALAERLSSAIVRGRAAPRGFARGWLAPRWMARGWVAPVCAALTALALLGQGLAYSVHSDVVLARADTRGLTRIWMLAHVPRGARVVIEPVVPEAWLAAGPAGARLGVAGRLWSKYPSLRSVIAPDGGLAPSESHDVELENYELTLSPALIGWYERQGYCWVLTGSTQSGRAFADRHGAPLALAYYRALAASGTVAYSVSPYSRDGGPIRFSFDWSFDYYPFAYERPGPQMTLYRLHGGRCGR